MSLTNTSLRARQVIILIKQDIQRTLQGPHGQLFLIFFALFWFWFLWQSSSGIASAFAGKNGQSDEAWFISWIFSLLFDGDQQVLFVEHPPTLSFYYVIAISSMPLFVLLAASNQTASDIGSQYLRFIIPRCTRMEIYVARFIGVSIIVNCSYLLITIAAAILSAAIDPDITLISLLGYALQISLSILFYSLPFIAFMALCSASLGSASLSALVGTTIYSILTLSISFVVFRWPDAAIASYIVPSVAKPLHLSLDFSDLIQSGIFSIVFIVFYAGLGWRVFSKRDI